MDTILDLTTALARLHELQLDDGDLAAEYWGQVARLLREAGSYQQRALAAEEKLRQIRAVIE